MPTTLAGGGGAIVVAALLASADEARCVAAAAVPGGRVAKIQSDDLDDRPVWRLTVQGLGGWVEVFVDAMTGTMINRRDDAPPDRP